MKTRRENNHGTRQGQCSKKVEKNQLIVTRNQLLFKLITEMFDRL